jgi:hypothetical protein
MSIIIDDGEDGYSLEFKILKTVMEIFYLHFKNYMNIQILSNNPIETKLIIENLNRLEEQIEIIRKNLEKKFEKLKLELAGGDKKSENDIYILKTTFIKLCENYETKKKDNDLKKVSIFSKFIENKNKSEVIDYFDDYYKNYVCANDCGNENEIDTSDDKFHTQSSIRFKEYNNKENLEKINNVKKQIISLSATLDNEVQSK